MTQSTPRAFAVGERALCFHGPLIYEAKIINTEMWIAADMSPSGEAGHHYFVHYKGWKMTWDEWVPESRMLKMNEENMARQRQLFEAQLAKDRLEREALNAKDREGKGTARKAADGGPPSAGLASARGTKRGRDTVAEADEEYLKRPEIKLPIPDDLKVLLVDDWEAITKNNQLVPLPRTPNVQTILQEYRDYCASGKFTDRATRSAQLLEEFTAGLNVYFDKCLGNNLLYRFERNQYGEIRKKRGEALEPSASYGAEHLLRLFVCLPEFIAHTTMDTDTVATLRDISTDFLKWLSKEQKRLFTSAENYIATSSAYQSVARS